jgi:predicted Mrr-cat superfamily restriction endonuclease
MTHNSKIVFLINDDARAIEAQYEPHGPVTVFKTMRSNIAVGDLVVVQSTTRFEATVVKVTSIDVEPDLESSTPINWVVDTIDNDAFKELLKGEDEAVQAVQTAERLRKKAEMRANLMKGHEAKINSLALANHADEAPVTE